MKAYLALLLVLPAISSCIKFSKVKTLTCEQKDSGYLKVDAVVVDQIEKFEKIHYNFCEEGPEGKVCGDTAVKDILFELKVEGQKNQRVFIPFRIVGRRDYKELTTGLASEEFTEIVKQNFTVGKTLSLRLSCLAQIDDPKTFVAGHECTSFPIYQDLGSGFVEYLQKGAGFANYDECLLTEKFPLKLPF